MKTPKSTPSSTDDDTIIYGPIVLPNGMRYNPESDSAVELLLKGKKVFVNSGDHYATLIRSFQRYTERNGIYGLKVGRAQVNESKWQIVVFPSKSKERPAAQFEKGFTRKHGRYKSYAIQLNQSATWHSPDFAEVKKVIAAWRLYVPAAERKDKRLVTKQTGKTWSVSIVPK